jgi:8-oxo-dGTP pyrophosphatase MutT (NUDIX family)
MIRQKHSVSVIPVNGRGEILLQQRDHKPGIPYPGMWTMFGGAVEDDDANFETAIHREIREELGLDFPVEHWLDYVCSVRSIPGELDFIVHVYTGELDRPLESLTLYEGQAMGWFDNEDVEALEFGFAKKPMVLKFLRERIAQQGKESL